MICPVIHSTLFCQLYLNSPFVLRYIYFPCSRRQFGLPGPSLLEIDHDERPEDGTLASSLSVSFNLAQYATPPRVTFEWKQTNNFVQFKFWRRTSFVEKKVQAGF